MLVKGSRFRGRVHAQLQTQEAAQVLVLRDGLAQLAGEGQQPHQLAVRFFTEGVERDQAGGVTLRRAILAAGGVGSGQLAQDIAGLLLQSFAPDEQPFVKGGGIGQAEAGEQFPLIERGGLCQSVQAGPAEVQLAMVMPLAFGQQPLKGQHIDYYQPGGRALDGLAGDREKCVSNAGDGFVQRLL